ncbi:MAG: pentapeptide repeat-containing protein [Chlorobiaceae bacterium]|nr:pentapeptide repeat-containing protein [Chlorobiaceae bacterium]
MKEKLTEQTISQVFEKVDGDSLTPDCRVYEDCRFIRCNFAHADLSGLIFRECSFEGCDMSMAKLKDTGFQEALFKECKLLGLQFNDCRKLLLRMEFQGCMLKLSLFSGLELKNTTFVDCDLQEADFTGANMSGSAFVKCDLRQALFFHTNLEKADFRSAVNYSIAPETNRIRKARFSLHGLAGLLDIYDIEIE